MSGHEKTGNFAPCGAALPEYPRQVRGPSQHMAFLTARRSQRRMRTKTDVFFESFRPVSLRTYSVKIPCSCGSNLSRHRISFAVSLNYCTPRQGQMQVFFHCITQFFSVNFYGFHKGKFSLCRLFLQRSYLYKYRGRSSALCIIFSFLFFCSPAHAPPATFLH